MAAKKKTDTAKSAPAPTVKAAPAPAAPAPAPVKPAPKAKAAVKPAPVKQPELLPAPKKSGAEERYRWIQDAAYFIAEKDGFRGDTLEYWAQAEQQFEEEFG